MVGVVEATAELPFSLLPQHSTVPSTTRRADRAIGRGDLHGVVRELRTPSLKDAERRSTRPVPSLPRVSLPQQ